MWKNPEKWPGEPKEEAMQATQEQKTTVEVPQAAPAQPLVAHRQEPVGVPNQWTHDQIALLKRTICKGSTNDEFELFLGQCKRTGLDPFAKQIHSVKRYDKKEQREVMSIQTGIDGYRLIAERTGKYRGQTKPQWCDKDGNWFDIWLKDVPPSGARVGIFKEGCAEPFWGIARWDSYVSEYYKDGGWNLSPMWKKMGDVMIAKCAEALGLRKAFPQELSGIYTAEEMAQAEGEASQDGMERAKPVVKPTMRETEAQGPVVRSLEPPVEDGPADHMAGSRSPAAMDKKINGTPLRSDKPTNNYPCPPDLDGTDITGEVAYLHRGDPHREVMLTAKKPVTRKKASELTDIEVAQFYKLLIWRWGAWVQKAKTPEEGDKSRGACLDELAAVLEADYERKKLESDADQYATALPKAPAKVD